MTCSFYVMDFAKVLIASPNSGFVAQRLRNFRNAFSSGSDSSPDAFFSDLDCVSSETFKISQQGISRASQRNRSVFVVGCLSASSIRLIDERLIPDR